MKNVASFIAIFILAAPILAYAVGNDSTLSPKPQIIYKQVNPTNPLNCSHDPAGMIYLALGRHIIKLPNLHYERITEESNSGLEIAPKPLKPSEAKGCPRNPMRILSIIAKLPSVSGEDESIAKVADATTITVYHQQPKDDYSSEKLFADSCKRYTDQIELAPGLVGCWFPKNEREASTGIGGRVIIQANPDFYSAPLENKFTLDCAYYSCQVKYKLHDDVLVQYEFHIQQIPYGKMTDFDKIIRQRIIATEVADHLWADERHSIDAGAKQ